jgi:hypothetical protein
MGRISIERLAEYVWPDAAKTPSTERFRRKKVRMALDELKDAGWQISETKGGICEIRRPRLISGGCV